MCACFSVFKKKKSFFDFVFNGKENDSKDLSDLSDLSKSQDKPQFKWVCVTYLENELQN